MNEQGSNGHEGLLFGGEDEPPNTLTQEASTRALSNGPKRKALHHISKEFLHSRNAKPRIEDGRGDRPEKRDKSSTHRSRPQPPSTKTIALCKEAWKTYKKEHEQSPRVHVCHYQARRERVGHDTGSVWVVPSSTIGTRLKQHRLSSAPQTSPPNRSKINLSRALILRSARHISPLCGVPTEILLLIAGYLTREESIILSLTCEHLKAALGLYDTFSSIIFSLAYTDDALIRVMRDINGPYRIPALIFLLGPLKAGPNDPCQRDAFLGWHALHFGCYYDDEAAITALLRYGANPNIPDVTGATSLHISYLYQPTGSRARNLLLDPPEGGIQANKRLVDMLGVLAGMYRFKSFQQPRHNIYGPDFEDRLGCTRCCTNR